MKILLSIVVCGRTGNSRQDCLYDGIELIYPDDGEDEKTFLQRALKSAEGKYTVICDRSFRLADVQSVLKIMDKNPADMVCFTCGAAIRTSVFKSIKDYTDAFSLRFSAVLACKQLLKTIYTPFAFEKMKAEFTEGDAEVLLYCANLFGKAKAKLTKDIYSYAFNLLCDRLVLYYVYALLAIKDKNLEADKLIAFDNKLKAEIVLYLALEKRFTYAELQKLRGRDFKTSWLTARKLRKL